MASLGGLLRPPDPPSPVSDADLLSAPVGSEEGLGPQLLTPPRGGLCLSVRLPQVLDVGEDRQAAALQEEIEQEGWEINHRVSAMAERLGVAPRDRLVSELSGGERRRVALARVLLASPKLLILDEPTNHLDAETIEWLQDWLTRFRGGVLLVTHDRYLLEASAVQGSEPSMQTER